MIERVEGIGNTAERADTARRPAVRARVAIAIRDLAFHQEVLDFLERDARVSVIGSVGQIDALLRLIASSQPDATVACPSTARDMRHPAANGRTPNLLVVAEEMTVPVLREAIEAGARAVFAWPEERGELASTIGSLPREHPAGLSGRGRIVAVYGPRGGVGATFLACQLAAAMADDGLRCVLVDLDASYADVTVALGVDPVQDALRTVSDLASVFDELTAEHVEDALYRHPRGFGVLLAPPHQSGISPFKPELYAAAVTQLAFSRQVTVLHVPRSIDDVAVAGLGISDEVVLLIAPDNLSLHSARRAIEAFGLADIPGHCRVVVNQLFRGGVKGADVERVLGFRPSGTLRFDSAVGRAQDRGALLPARGHGAARDVRTLARQLMAHAMPPEEANGGRHVH